MSDSIDVAVVGAMGAFGTAVLSLLEERNFPVGNLYLLDANPSDAERLEFRGKYYAVGDVRDFDFAEARLAFFIAGEEVAAAYAAEAVASGCVVIDSSAQFRNDAEVPLVVAAVNPEAIGQYTARGMVACPASVVVLITTALKPLHDAVGIERISVATYQAVSEGGKEAVDDLAAQTVALLNMQAVEPRFFAGQIAFNVLPLVGVVQDDGSTDEEARICHETKKILADDALEIDATAVYVPVFHGHAAALHVATTAPVTVAAVRRTLGSAPGVVVDAGDAPTAVTDAIGQDAVYVGRIRQAGSVGKGISLWVVVDNIRVGSALNSVQIAEILVKSHF